jgi:hypothetical protein
MSMSRSIDIPVKDMEEKSKTYNDIKGSMDVYGYVHMSDYYLSKGYFNELRLTVVIYNKAMLIDLRIKEMLLEYLI